MARKLQIEFDEDFLPVVIDALVTNGAPSYRVLRDGEVVGEGGCTGAWMRGSEPEGAQGGKGGYARAPSRRDKRET